MKKNNLFKKSKNFSDEYCISIVRVGEIKPIEGADRIGQTFINGESVVINKKEIHEGDILFYASDECQLSDKFLSINNLYEISEYSRNSNCESVQKLIEEGKKDEAKHMAGFFNKYGRVRRIRLKGIASLGYLFTLSELANAYPEVADANLEDYVGTDFDLIQEGDEDVFVKAYVPPIKESTPRVSSSERNKKKILRFDRMIDGEFEFHYSTSPLPKCINYLSPASDVTCSVKMHGTSIIIANVKVKVPIKLPFFKSLFNKFVDKTGLLKNKRITDYYIDYGAIYSSRTVIKNQYINKNVTSGFYNEDIWTKYGELLIPHIPKGMTVYGEICGFLSDGQAIQKGYDYGCNSERGESFIMLYRITKENENGEKEEWNVGSVHDWTVSLIEDHPELKDVVHPITILYMGKLINLYQDLPLNDANWHENLLERMRNDKERFGLELNEPLCKNAVPRAGIVLRVTNDPLKEAFKLKSEAFKKRELSEIDNGNVDIETAEGYTK